MKTPREILFQKHQAVEPKLDSIRELVVREGRRTVVARTGAADTPGFPGFSWRAFLFPLRWHLAGLGVAWVVIILLNLNIGHTVSLGSAMPVAKIPPPQIILASLRENRRELLEMIQPADSHDARPAKLFPLQPRSERLNETLTA